MRATVCSSRKAATLLVALALTSSGCTSVVGTSKRRGKLMSTTQVGSDTKRLGGIQVEGDTARLAFIDRTCDRVAREYQQVEVQKVRQDLSTESIAVLGIAGAGLASLLLALDMDEEDESTPYFFWGGAAGVTIGLSFWLGDGFGPGPTTERTTPSGVQRHEEVECRDATLAQRGRLPWKLSVGGSTRSGQTDEGGELHTAPVIVALLMEHANDEYALKRLVRTSNVSYTIGLGNAAPVNATLDTRRLPDAFFAQLAVRYDRQLAGEGRARWENCRIISRSSREAFECLWSQ